jgi:hypothetical protein
VFFSEYAKKCLAVEIDPLPYVHDIVSIAEETEKAVSRIVLVRLGLPAYHYNRTPIVGGGFLTS